MLKFQTNHTTEIANFEDFILIAFVISDSEIITISICGELAGIDSENAWFSFVKRNYRHLFPTLCSRTRFNRIRRALPQITELIRQKMLSAFSVPSSRYFAADSFPLPVCKFGRAYFCRSYCETLTSKQ